MAKPSPSPVAALPARVSHGLDQFFCSIQDQHGLRILDMAGASQSNIGVITSLGHRLYSDDILRTLDATFGSGEEESLANQSDPAKIKQFFDQTLDFPPAHFDGALVWDTLQFLSPAVLQMTIERLRHVLRSSAHMLALFHAEEKGGQVPMYSYRILDPKMMSLTPRGHRQPARTFNNRGLEKLFHEFQSLKFFLTRDHLREVIVRR